MIYRQNGNALNQHLGVSAPNEDAARVYRALRFFEPPPVPFWRLSISRLNVLSAPLYMLRRLIVRRGSQFKLLDRGIAFTEAPTRAFVYCMLKLICGRAVSGIRLAPLKRIRDELAASLMIDSKIPCFIRDAKLLNWMCEYPWISTNPQDHCQLNYFSDYLEGFATECVKLYDQTSRRLIGVLMLRLSSNAMKLAARPVGYGATNLKDKLRILAVTLTLAGDHKADVVEIPDGLYDELRQLVGLSWIFMRQQHRYFFYPRRGDKEAAEALQRLHLRYLDGDTAFV